MSLLAEFEQSLMAAIDSDSDEPVRTVGDACEISDSPILSRAYEEHVSQRLSILTSGIVEEPMSKDDLVQQARCLDSWCATGDKSANELQELATRLLRQTGAEGKEVWHTRVALSLANCLTSEAIRDTCPYANDAWVELLTGTGWTGVNEAKLRQIAQNGPRDVSWAGCMDIDGDVTCWRNSDMAQIPPSWSCMRLSGSLDLSNNGLSTLPAGGITVGKDLNLRHNELVDLGCGVLTVGRNLDVSHNRLSTWPANLLHSLIGDGIYLDHNSIGSLPVNIDETLSICGTLSLRANALRSLPSSMQRVVIGGDLDLRENMFTEAADVHLEMMIGGELLLDKGTSVSKVLDSLQRIFDTDRISYLENKKI